MSSKFILLSAATLLACASESPPKAVLGIQVPSTQNRTLSQSHRASPRSLTEECNAFIDTVNSAVRRIEALSAGKGDEDDVIADKMRKIAEAWDSVARDVERIHVASNELRDSARRYVSMCKNAAASARKVAAALESKNAEDGMAAQESFDSVVKEEDVLVDQVNQICMAPSKSARFPRDKAHEWREQLAATDEPFDEPTPSQ